MNKFVSTSLNVLAATLVFSCASTPKPATQTEAKENVTEEKAVIETQTEAEIFSQKLSLLKLTIESSPKEAIKGKSFSSPYIVKVETSDSLPAPQVSITVKYPSARSNGEIIFSQSEIITSEDGRASFMPSIPDFSFNSEITFEPKAESSDEAVAKIASEKAVKAPFKVQTNQKSAGGVISMVDFNQNGKAITSNPISSSKLLMTLMRLGFTKIGNIDLTNQVLVGDDAKTYARAKAIVGNSSSFLIFGTVKITSTEKTEAGSSYTLAGSLTAIDLKTGNVILRTEKTVSNTEKNDWNALDNARKSLAEAFAAEIKYGI